MAKTKHRGDLTITAENLWKYQELTEVSGYVDIRAENASLPALTEVSGYVYEQPAPEIIATRLASVAAHALAAPKALRMSCWHACKTSHCIAGWAIHLAGEEGYELERKVGSSNAGLILLGVDAASKFRLKDDEAKAWLQTFVASEAQ